MARISKKVNHSHILLVESETDRGFLEQICKLELNELPKIKPQEVKVCPPKDYQQDYEEWLYNRKQGVLNLLEDLLPELTNQDAATKKLAAIVDADYGNNKINGFEETLNQVKEKAAKFNFYLAENDNNGLIFKHQEEDAKFGLWIMPNNQANGELEDFIKFCIQENEALFRHAVQIVENLPEKKFNPTDKTKAEVATWLAWQKPPGHGVYWTVYDGLLNTDYALFQELQNWLKQVFA